MRQETISPIETDNPATRLDTLLTVLAALELELSLGPRTRVRALEDLIG